MPREAIQRIIAEYPGGREENLANHPLAEWIRRDVPQIFAEATPEFSDMTWVASPGQGRWADAPWIAAFDSLVTETAQEGYYPDLLFTRSLDGVFLSLNQGMAHLRQELGVEAKATLAHCAAIIRNRVSPDFQSRFNLNPIDLQPSGSTSRLAFYEPGHAFGTHYRADAIPRNEDIVADIREMLRLYALATVRGGAQELDTSGYAVADDVEQFLAGATLEEKRRLRLHFRVERRKRLSELAKGIHGYRCQICGFDFEEVYGDLGHQYIEAHHLTPLAQLPPNQEVHLSPRDDFAVVCANCHRMLHRRGAPDSFEVFRAQYSDLH